MRALDPILVRRLAEWNIENAPGEAELIALCSFGLLPERGARRCDGLLALTDQAFFVFADGVRIREIGLDEIASFRIETAVGCAYVECVLREGETPVRAAGADNAALRTLSSFVRQANRVLLRQDTPPEASSRDRQRRCPRCGRPFPRGAHTCPRCASKKESLLRLMRMGAPEWKYILVAAVFFLLSTLTGLLLPYLNRVMVDDYIRANPDRSAFWLGFVGVVGAVFLFNVLRHLISIARGRALVLGGNRLVRRLRGEVFSKIEALSFDDVTRRSTGEMMKLVGSDTARIRLFLINQLPNLIEQMLLLLAIAVLLFWYDWKLALLILVPAPISTLALRLVWTWMRKLFARRRELNARANSVLHDVFSGIRVVKAYGMEKREEARFVAMAEEERDAQLRQEKLWALLMPFLNFCMSVGEFFLLYYVGSEMLAGRMTAGEMSQFSAYAGMVYAPLSALMRLPRQFLMMMTSLTKIYELMDIPTERREGHRGIGRLEGRIDVEDVRFAYDEKEVLHGVDLHIRPGEFIGLVGHSGVGKSTLINLIMRMYDVNSGAIRIDGVDLREIPEERLRSQMGVVLQETFLFSGTIWQNLTYAKPDATREQVLNAARMAGAHGFIVRLPDGYNTYVGERGHTLSGGERQRIAIARALLHDPRILILDEATSSLDTETETLVQEALRRLCHGRTTIAIAHRLSTLRNATRLVVLDQGRVAEEGTHTELMERGGIYYGLVMAQREMSRME